MKRRKFFPGQLVRFSSDIINQLRQSEPASYCLVRAARYQDLKFVDHSVRSNKIFTVIQHLDGDAHTQADYATRDLYEPITNVRGRDLYLVLGDDGIYALSSNVLVAVE